MNSTNHPRDPGGAHEALFDQIERELAALTFASLDAAAGDPAPRYCVDEFSTDFLNWSMPPHHGRTRHSAR